VKAALVHVLAMASGARDNPRCHLCTLTSPEPLPCFDELHKLKPGYFPWKHEACFLEKGCTAADQKELFFLFLLRTEFIYCELVALRPVLHNRASEMFVIEPGLEFGVNVTVCNSVWTDVSGM
jgi:hypothetical protein